jgi:iron complex outermembrane receptor protein
MQVSRSPLFRIIVVLFTVTAASPSRAQTPALPSFEQQIVVTPTRSESTLDRVPAFVTLVGSKDIEESSAQDVADLLRQAGAHVTDVAGNRRSYRVDLRGFGATAGLNTLVLVDGRRVNEPDLGGTDWALIPLEQVERIEVIRGGGGAVTYGDSAAAGVINIITRGAAAAATSASIKGGAYSSFGAELQSRGTRGATSYALSGGYDRSDGHRDNSATEGGNIGGQLAIHASDRFQLDLRGGYHGDKTGLPGALLASDLASGVDRAFSKTSQDFADIDDGYVMVTPRAVLGGRGEASLDFSVRQRDSLFFSSFSGGEFSGDTGTRTIAASPKVVLHVPFASTVNQFVAGVDLASAAEDITNTLNVGGAPDTGSFTLKKVNRAVYLQDEMRMGRATVTAGYRYDRADYTFTPSAPSERDFHANLGSVGATVRGSAHAAIFGRLSRSFRYPVLDEMFDFFGNTIATSLQPQRSLDLDGGVRFESDSTQASVSVFRLVAKDEIFFNPIGGESGFGANENLDGESHRSGVEIAVSTRVGRAQFGGTMTVMATDVNGGAYDGRNIPGVPGQRATINAQLPIARRLSLGLEGLFVGERRFEGDFAGQFADQESYVVANAKLTYRQGRIRVFVDLKNLFDQEYSEYGVLGGFPTQPAFYPSPGMHALAGIAVGF